MEEFSGRVYKLKYPLIGTRKNLTCKVISNDIKKEIIIAVVEGKASPSLLK